MDWQAVDGAMTKAPLGGKGTGPNPTDRGKSETKRSLLTDGRGIPLALAAEVTDRMAPAVVSAAAFVTRTIGLDPGRRHIPAGRATPARRPLFPDCPPLGNLPAGPPDAVGGKPWATRVRQALAEHGIMGAVVVAEVTGPAVANVHVGLPPGVRASQLRAWGLTHLPPRWLTTQQSSPVTGSYSIQRMVRKDPSRRRSSTSPWFTRAGTEHSVARVEGRRCVRLFGACQDSYAPCRNHYKY